MLKEAADAERVQAVHSVAAGETYRQPTHEVLRLIALGQTSAEIATQLFLSIRTVESHRVHIQQKLGLAGRAELVRDALDHDLVEI